MSGHAPVLLAEVIAALAPKAGETHVDATFGGGGYARAILATGARVIGVDRDPAAIARGAGLGLSGLTVREGRFGDLEALVEGPVDGVVFDFGVSSFQLDEAARGFSFRFDADLDMRMGAAGPTAADAVNRLSEAALADALYGLGEETQSRRVARAIVEARAGGPITRTVALADLVEKALGGRRGAKIHPATRTFQALRMLVNDELGEIARGLSAAERLLRAGGRLVAVSFHSLEDRLVKSFLAERSGAQGSGSRHAPEAPAGPAPSMRQPDRRGVSPGEPEINANPRARSARLRWAVRTEAPAFRGADDVGLAPIAQAEWARIMEARA